LIKLHVGSEDWRRARLKVSDLGECGIFLSIRFCRSGSGRSWITSSVNASKKAQSAIRSFKYAFTSLPNKNRALPFA
jgi:hypothetical protein